MHIMRTVSDGLMIVYWYVTSNTKLLFMQVQGCKHIIWYVPVSNRLALIWNRLHMELIVISFPSVGCARSIWVDFILRMSVTSFSKV